MPRLKPLLAAIAVAFLFGLPCRAWNFGTPVETSVSFEFTVNGTPFAPGVYIIDKATTGNGSVLSIRPKNTSSIMMFDTDELPWRRDSSTVQLVFTKHGGKYYLSEVWGLEANGRKVRNTAR